MNISKINKIIYICNHASFFLSHRHNLASFCKEKKIQFDLLIGQSASIELERKSLDKLNELNILFRLFNFHTSKTNIFNDFFALFNIFKYIKKQNPTIVHAISNKPIIFSIIISFFCKANFVLSFSGFGYLYSNDNNKFKRIIFEKIIKIFLNERCNFIVQNTRDYNYLIKSYHVKKKNLYLIKGSGIDLSLYNLNVNFIDNNIVLFPSRPLISKGIIEFCEAAELLKKKYLNWRFVVVGDFNYESPDMISNDRLKKYTDNKKIEFWGFKEDMLDVYKLAKIVCLPSYREGFPKILIEAAALGLPTIVSDDPGCQEAIIPNKTGLISPVKNIEKLAENIIILMTNSELYKDFSNNSKILARNSFNIKNITESHQNIYYKLGT